MWWIRLTLNKNLSGTWSTPYVGAVGLVASLIHLPRATSLKLLGASKLGNTDVYANGPPFFRRVERFRRAPLCNLSIKGRFRVGIQLVESLSEKAPRYDSKIY